MSIDDKNIRRNVLVKILVKKMGELYAELSYSISWE